MTDLPDDKVALDKISQDSNAFSLAILRTSPDCVKLLDPDGSVSFMSENGLCAMEISDFGDISGQTWWELWPEDHREALSAAFRKAVSGEDASYSGWCPTAKGTMKNWDVRITPLQEPDGSIRSVLAVSRDVTHF